MDPTLAVGVLLVLFPTFFLGLLYMQPTETYNLLCWVGYNHSIESVEGIQVDWQFRTFNQVLSGAK